MDLQIIILAAGKGTRMNSALPKVLVGLAGKPLIQHLLDNIKPLKTSKPPIIVVGFKYELVQSYLGSGYVYAFQEGQFGTAHAASAGLEKVDAGNVLILYGDMPFVSAKSIEKLIDLHEQSRSMFSMLTATVPNFQNEYLSLMSFGRIIRNESGKVLKNTEFIDATDSEKLIKEVNPSFYLFNTQWLKNNIGKVNKNAHGEYYLTDLLELAVKNDVPVLTSPIDPKEALGVNTPEQLAHAAKIL